MLELNQPSARQETWNTESKGSVPVVHYPRHRISVAIEIPFQRADLPAISLILLALTLIGWGIWTDNSFRLLFGAAPALTPGAPLLPSLLQQTGVPLTFALALALLIFAGALALSPLRWWAYIRLVYKTGFSAQRRHPKPEDPDDAEAWVAAQAAWIEEYEAAAKQAEATPERRESPLEDTASPPANQPATETVAAATPASTSATAHQPSPDPTAAEEAAPGQTAAAQAASDQGAAAPAKDGQANRAQTPQALKPAPEESRVAQQEAAEEAQKPTQPKPGTKPSQQPSTDLAALAEETKEAALDLEELTDVEDILSSFTDNDTISPQLLSLSESVDDVDVTMLVTHARQINRQFDQMRLTE